MEQPCTPQPPINPYVMAVVALLAHARQLALLLREIARFLGRIAKRRRRRKL